MTSTANTVSQPATEMPTGPSFAAALCGFLGSTVATTMVLLLLGSSV